MVSTWPRRQADATLVQLYRPGDVIAGKYALQHVLGEGGMGTVWLARNEILEVDVAIKLLRSEFASHAEAGQRFLHEARATAKLKHPNIVQLHDFGTTRHGHNFMVMEFLSGSSLADVLETRPVLDPIETVQLMLQVLDALALAHEHGVVHRDLKPENIQVLFGAETRTCKVMDFGIAKVSSAPDIEDTWTDMSVDSAVQRSVSRLTQLGELVGSPQYMAPEQARGAGDVDHRADIWGVAVCIYECIAGERPFDHEHLDQLLLQVLMHAPPCPPGLDPSLWAVIAKGLAKNREERFQTAESFGEALAGWLVDQGVDVDASGRSVRNRWLGASLLESTTRLTMPSLSGAEAFPPAPPAPHGGRAKLAIVGAAAVVLSGVVGALVVTRAQPDDTPANEALPARAEPLPERAPVEPEAPAPAEAEPEPPTPAASAEPAPSPEVAPPKPNQPPKPTAPPPVAPPRAPKPSGGLALPSDADY